MTKAFVPRQARAALLLSATFALLHFVAAGCTFQVRADPNDPLFQARQFAVEPLTFANLMVGDKPEQVYLQGKDQKQRDSFEQDKAEAARLFFQHFQNLLTPAGIQVGPPGPGAPFTIRVNVEFFEPGSYTFFVNIPTELRMTLQVFNAQGQPVGQTPLVARVPATMSNPASGTRFRQAGEGLGDAAGHYILRRTGLGY
jgi:hypothetical protein